MEHHRGKAERSLVTATIITLMLAVSPAHAQSSPQASKDADIDAFLANLERTSATQAQAPAKAAPVRREAAARAVEQLDPSDAAIEALPHVQASPMLPEIPQDHGPFRTLLLMIGGIAACALATVGLTLTFFALRKEMKRKKHGRRRRFSPFDSPGAVHTANR